MIPTLLLLGLVLGRWWKTTLVVGTVGWPMVLLVGGLVDPGQQLLAAALLGLANTAVGVGLHQAALALVRWPRRRSETAGHHADDGPAT